MGIVESVSITTSTFPLRSQEEIGQGGGLSGSTRNFVSAIAVAVFTATLSNRLLVTVPKHVYPVARNHGVPESSLPALVNALQGKTSCVSRIPHLHVLTITQAKAVMPTLTDSRTPQRPPFRHPGRLRSSMLLAPSS